MGRSEGEADSVLFTVDEGASETTGEGGWVGNEDGCPDGGNV